ncbi:LRR receptor-like kinase family protein [Arachis hypogaea]|nr:LRR receptor-like kinase family protein [Arachis hypogaea]
MILNIDFDMLWFYELIDLILIILDLNLAEVVLLPNLLALNLSNNKLEGSISSDFKSFGALYSLDLSGNLLNGTIPRVLGELKQLQCTYTLCDWCFKEMQPEEQFFIWSHDGKMAFETIIKAANNFDDKYLIGIGGQRSVYKAELPLGMVVAVEQTSHGIKCG